MDDNDLARDMRWTRFGYLDGGDPCDTIVQAAVALVPGDGVLPTRWSYKNPDHFTRTYGDLGEVVWAKTASYHLLVVGTVHVLRIWTDMKKSCFVDMADALAVRVPFGYEVVPESTYKKTKPLTKRARITTVDQLVTILMLAGDIYGLDIA